RLATFTSWNSVTAATAPPLPRGEKQPAVLFEECSVAERDDRAAEGNSLPPGMPADPTLPEAPTRPAVTEAWSSSSLLLPGTPWPPGHVLLDDFEVEGVLGQGGMGVVYRVRQRSTGQLLAVKRARLTEGGIRRRFLAELQLWIDLPVHPHLAACRFF